MAQREAELFMRHEVDGPLLGYVQGFLLSSIGSVI